VHRAVDSAVDGDASILPDPNRAVQSPRDDRLAGLELTAPPG
jgi:hypothetical protein